MKGHLTVVLFTALACSDRHADSLGPPVDELCMDAGSMGYWADGRQHRVWVDGNTPDVCVCITEDEFWDAARIAELEAEMREDLLVLCEAAAARQGMDWNDCQADYESGEWFAWMHSWSGFECGGEGWVGPSDPYDDPPIDCELGELGCSCTVGGACDPGGTCIDGMCQTPP
jgi:hypothetical protein